MFGAYQVGAWKVVSHHFKPDLVIGVSIGSLNAWMVACGCDVKMIEQHWLEGESLEHPTLRMPKHWREGFLDPTAAHTVMQRMHRELTPQLPLGIVVRRLPSFQAEVICNQAISSWRHLAASCAIPLVFDLQQWKGTTYMDGGLLDPLPLFAARDLGATSILGINCMSWGGYRVKAPQIRPARILSWSPVDALCWNRQNVIRWMAQGEADAQAFVDQYSYPSSGLEKTFAADLF